MEYIYLGIGFIIGFHALTFARWLKRNGNLLGAVGIVILVLFTLSLPVFRMLRSS